MHLTRNVNSVSMEAFLLAATDIGIFKSLDDAASKIEIGQCYTPTENHRKTCMKYFEIFECLSHKPGSKFEKIAELQ